MNNIVITRAKYEQAYINTFINHYLNLGFNHIYIFIEHTEKYEEQSYTNVTFIKYVKKEKVINNKILLNFLKNKKNIDWVLYCDCDEFLFLENNIKIKDYINKYYKPGIGQFLFKWAMIENYKSLKNENNMKNIFNYSNIYTNSHYKSLFRLKNLINITCPHFAVINNNTYLNNKKITNLVGYFKNEHNNNNNINVNDYTSFVLHYHNRNAENTIIKCLTYWYNNIDLNILNKINNIPVNDIKKYISKINLSFHHSRFKKINKYIKNKNINFIENMTIDIQKEYDIIYSLSKKYNIEICKINNLIETIDKKISPFFLEKDIKINQLINAKYGSNEKKIDVTEIIKNILSKNNNYLILDKKYNVLFKKDPHLGVIKHLNIKYKNNKDDTK